MAKLPEVLVLSSVAFSSPAFLRYKERTVHATESYGGTRPLHKVHSKGRFPTNCTGENMQNISVTTNSLLGGSKSGKSHTYFPGLLLPTSLSKFQLARGRQAWVCLVLAADDLKF